MLWHITRVWIVYDISMQCATKIHHSQSNSYSTKETTEQWKMKPGVDIDKLFNKCHNAQFEIRFSESKYWFVPKFDKNGKSMRTPTI